MFLIIIQIALQIWQIKHIKLTKLIKIWQLIIQVLISLWIKLNTTRLQIAHYIIIVQIVVLYTKTIKHTIIIAVQIPVAQIILNKTIKLTRIHQMELALEVVLNAWILISANNAN